MEKRSNEVYWPPDEKVVGILGLAPQATYDFYRKFVKANPAEKDWQYVRVIIDVNTKIPSRGRCLELGETSPVPHMRQAILNLKKAGADFVVIPCNTAHYFYDDVVKGLGVPVINIIAETYRHIMKSHPKIQCLGLLASENTIKFDLYEAYFDQSKVKILTPEAGQDIVNHAIETVKVGNLGVETKDSIRKVCKDLIKRGAEGIVLGCTEISLILDKYELDVPIYDSNEILAGAAVREAQTDNGG